MNDTGTAEVPIWSPSPERLEAARITRFQAWLRTSRGLEFKCYEDLWIWSTDHPTEFWPAVAEYYGVQLTINEPGGVLQLPPGGMPGARWFEGSKLNFAHHLLNAREHATVALTYDSEAAGGGEVTWDELRRQAGAFAATLQAAGVQQGDRVAAYLPNIPQAIVAFIAVASLGAVWSICGPDIGVAGTVDRFGQVKPVVLVACDGYRHGGKNHDRRNTVGQLMERLPTVRTLVWVQHLDKSASAPPGHTAVDWTDATTGDTPLAPHAVPFDHPLWILYSSGTTGLPKPIVHGHGGMLLTGLVLTDLHTDLGPSDRMMWLGSTSWMVWNVQLMGLLTGTTLCLVDGSVTGPSTPDWNFIWRLADRRKVTLLGAGAAFHAACMKGGAIPRDIAALPSLRTVASTGSPMAPEVYRWILESVKHDVWINCVSGGTDLCGAFLAGTPALPLYLGEMQCRALGAAVQSFDTTGDAVLNAVGELVCTRPTPSMPLFFWNDLDGSRYRASYFEMFTTKSGAAVWRHGDWLRLVPRDQATGGVIYGRSDATINRGGIRMGTAELYRAVEAEEAVADSVAVDLEYLGRESALLLFVVLKPGALLDEPLAKRLRAVIRERMSARHVPDEIHQVPSLPRTLTGKKLEIPLKRLLLGMPIEKAVQKDAVTDADALDWFIAFAEARLKLQSAHPEA